MKWRGGRRSTNVEDRTGARGAGTGASRGAKVGGGLGGLGLIAIVALFLLGGDPMQLLSQVLGGGQSPSAPASAGRAPAPSSAPASPGQPSYSEEKDFVSVVLADTEDTWNALFQQYGSRYSEPKMVLFSDGVNSACGFNTAASGPFYCPGDHTLYLDLGFFHELQRLGAPGDFAQAYVIGHEVAHHVQNLTGVLSKAQSLQRRVSKVDANKVQVLVELQADCYAGVWAHHAARDRGLLERGDVEEGLRAAASIGDDRLQQRAGRRVRPESFTHGSSEQRVTWLKQGMSSGDLGQCDTFADAGVRL